MIASTTLPSHNNLQKTVQEVLQQMLGTESQPAMCMGVGEQAIIRIQDIREQFEGLKVLSIWVK